MQQVLPFATLLTTCRYCSFCFKFCYLQQHCRQILQRSLVHLLENFTYLVTCTAENSQLGNYLRAKTGPNSLKVEGTGVPKLLSEPQCWTKLTETLAWRASLSLGDALQASPVRPTSYERCRCADEPSMSKINHRSAIRDDTCFPPSLLSRSGSSCACRTRPRNGFASNAFW